AWRKCGAYLVPREPSNGLRMRLQSYLAQPQATQSEWFGILLVYIGAKLKTFERGPMALRRRVSGASCVSALICLSCLAAPLHAQVPRAATFLAEHYDVSASVDAIGQSISATAKIDFKAVEASSSVRVELHPNLIVKEVKGPDGKPLNFERDNQNPLMVVVQLPTPVATGGHLTLTYSYAGLLVNEENSPVPGVRAALINKDGAYLLLLARWFPLTNFPSNRYTATFRLNVPDIFAVAGTGKASAPTPMPSKNAVEGGRLLYTFECKNPAPHGTFVAGKLQLNPKQAEGISVAVYAPRASSANAEEFAGQEAGIRAVDEFWVGALMYEDAAPIAQAARLAPYSPDYRSVVMNKGAMLFHMLRAQMGDVAFKSALRDFYFQFAEKSAR